MNALRRLLLCLWSLLLIAIAAVIGVAAFRQDVAASLLHYTDLVLVGGSYFWWLLIAAVALLALGMLGVFVSLARKTEPTQVVIVADEGGQINISLTAVDNVVRKAALSVDAVRDVKTRLKAVSDGLGIGLQVVIGQDVSVPETASAVQAAVRAQMEAVTGLQVKEVTVLVSAVADASQAAVKLE